MEIFGDPNIELIILVVVLLFLSFACSAIKGGYELDSTFLSRKGGQ